MVPLLAALLSLPLPARFPALTLSPQRQKRKTLEAVLAVLMAVAAQQPLLFIVEDLHWVDPSTLDLLGLLIDQTPTTRIFMVLTCRPEVRPPWPPRSHLTQLTLNRLTRPQVETMVMRVTGGKPLPAEVVRQVAAKTDGVPLFVEESTTMVLESGLLQEREHHYELVGPLPPLAIPATLHDSLMARLDQLAAVKAVAQLGATIGRQFSYDVLQAVSRVDEATLQQALAQLVEAELLYQQGLPPQATYLFKHALIQEAAYQSLLKSRRQHYHRQIAQVLAERFPQTVETQPELLAHHYTEAGLKAQAIPYWQRAGQRAIERSAHLEGIAHLTKGLEVLRTQSDTPKRTQQELVLQTALGSALMAMKGYAASEVEQAYTRARALCQQVGETPRLIPMLGGLGVFYLVRGELQTAREVGEQLLRLAQRQQDPVLLLRGHMALGLALFHLGEVASAHMHLEKGMALYGPHQPRSRSPRGVDLRVGCLSYVTWTLWWLGYPDQAMARSRGALTLAQELSHPHTLAFALNHAAMIHRFRREGQAAMRLSTEQDFPFWLAWGTILRGWALTEQRLSEEGIAQIGQGLAAFQATGAEIQRSYFLGLLADAYGKAGQAEAALSVLDKAQGVADETGERHTEAELHRLKGELLLWQVVGTGFNPVPTESSMLAETDVGLHGRAPLLTEAKACFHRALAIARHQQAKSLELRAAMSLSRLWQRQGKRTEARQLLEEIYGWFTEGFDTADLQEANALLNDLW